MDVAPSQLGEARPEFPTWTGDTRRVVHADHHIDHAGALTLLQAEWEVPTYMPAADRPRFETLPMQGTIGVTSSPKRAR